MKVRLTVPLGQQGGDWTAQEEAGCCSPSRVLTSNGTHPASPEEPIRRKRGVYCEAAETPK